MGAAVTITFENGRRPQIMLAEHEVAYCHKLEGVGELEVLEREYIHFKAFQQWVRHDPELKFREDVRILFHFAEKYEVPALQAAIGAYFEQPKDQEIFDDALECGVSDTRIEWMAELITNGQAFVPASVVTKPWYAEMAQRLLREQIMKKLETMRAEIEECRTDPALDFNLTYLRYRRRAVEDSIVHAALSLEEFQDLIINAEALLQG